MINKYISEMVAQEDKSTAEHSGRVAKIADILGRALRNLPSHPCDFSHELDGSAF